MYPPCNLPFRSIKARPSPPAARPLRGFSLIELMVAVAILAILLALAVPSFQDMIQRNRVRTAAADLTTGLNLARAEAIKRGLSVSLCVNDTSNAWSVWASSEVRGTCEDEDGKPPPIRCGYLDSGITLEPKESETYGDEGLQCIRFRPDGLAYKHKTNPTLLTAGALTVSAGTHERVVNIKVGSIHVTED